MSQAEELLNSLSANSDTEPMIYVSDARIITVPDVLKKIAVQHDHNVETVTFDCPRYWDGHDMSKWTIQIIYTTAAGKPGDFIATNCRVNEADSSRINFDWTILDYLTQDSGSISFYICITDTAEDGTVFHHWNTELCTDAYVSKGGDCHAMETLYPDVFSQWHTKLSAILAGEVY